MSHQSDLIAEDIEAYLKQHEHKSLLRFITCGSVDDGKSTLIGRMLYESKMIYEDQLASLEKDSKSMGTQGEKIDFALLVDGLAAEREQGITIDVAYRYFSTEKRKFIVADTPGHEQYTRNMATGASTADLAILMIDARKGVLTQTKRHAHIVSLLGVGHILLCINKMDLVNYDAKVFDSIVADFKQFSAHLQINALTAIPVSALEGDNMTILSSKMPWYTGRSLMSFLETVEIQAAQTSPFSMPVQWVNRPNLDFRGFSGQIATGHIKVGDEVEVYPSKLCSKLESIHHFEGSVEAAVQGESVTLCLADEVDISRGDVIVAKNAEIDLATGLKATLLWMNENELVVNKSYWLKCGSKLLTCMVQEPDYALDVNTQEKRQVATLGLNDIAVCDILLDQALACLPYKKNKALGSFILIDRMSNNTVAMGLVESTQLEKDWADQYVARRKRFWVKSDLSRESRSQKYGHEPMLVLFTGKCSKGFASYQNECEAKLFQKGIAAYKYGFQFMRSAVDTEDSRQDFRLEMIQQLIEMAYAFLDAGQVFITAVNTLSAAELAVIKKLIAPFKSVVISVGNTQPFSDCNVPEGQGLSEALIETLAQRCGR